MIVRIKRKETGRDQLIECDRLDQAILPKGGEVQPDRKQLHVQFFKYEKLVYDWFLDVPVKLFIMNDNGKTIDTILFNPE